MLPITYFRSSSIKTLNDCELRYFIQYCLGINFPSGPAAIKGSIFHSCMEILANCKKLQQRRKSPYLYRDSSGYTVKYNDIYDIDIDHLSKYVYDYYIKDIPEDRVPPCYKKITNWIKYKDIQKSIKNVFEMSPRSFDVRKMNIYMAEPRFNIVFNEPWAGYDFTFRGKRYQGNLSLRGAIDVINYNEEIGGYEIIDWKTGTSTNLNSGEKKTYDDYCEDLQLAIYYLAAKQYFNIDIKQVTIVFINESNSFSIVYDDEQDIIDKVRDIFIRTKNIEKPKKNQTDFCIKFCPYVKNSFNNVVGTPEIPAEKYVWEYPDGLLEEKEYRICGQLEACLNRLTPLEVMEKVTRDNYNIDIYKNW